MRFLNHIFGFMEFADFLKVSRRRLVLILHWHYHDRYHQNCIHKYIACLVSDRNLLFCRKYGRDWFGRLLRR